MSNARNLSKLLGTDTQITTPDIADGVFQANKNLIINGAMQVAQRGTSFTPSGVTYCLDRFAHYAPSPPSNAVQQSTDVPSSEGFQYSVRMDTIDLRHAVELLSNGEAGIFYSGQRLTLSFWAKTGSSTKSATINLRFIDGAAFGNVSSAFSSSNNSIVITDSWQRFSIQYTVDTTPTASHYACGFSIGASANILYITGVQLELGDTATPFEHRSYGDELARCQRYYEKKGQPSTATAWTFYEMSAVIATTTSYVQGDKFKVEKRADPTLVFYSRNGTSGKISSFNSGADVTGSWAQNARGATGFHAVAGPASSVIKGDGYEYGYTADAEL